jgi:hypothetical protein
VVFGRVAVAWSPHRSKIANNQTCILNTSGGEYKFFLAVAGGELK